MDTLSFTIGLSMIAVGLAMAGSAVPMAMGRTRRNRWYGVRLPASMASDEAWDAINRYGGRQLIAASVPVVIMGVVALTVSLKQHPLLTLLYPVVVLASVGVAMARVLIFEARYARATTPTPTREGR